MMIARVPVTPLCERSIPIKVNVAIILIVAVFPFFVLTFDCLVVDQLIVFGFQIPFLSVLRRF